MKKIFRLILSIGLLIFAFRGCLALFDFPDSSNASGYEKEFTVFDSLIAKENAVAAKLFADSLRKKKELPDSIFKKFDKDVAVLETRMAEKAKVKKRLFELRSKKDEFQGVTFYYDRSSPKFVNQNGIYLYFDVNSEDQAENLRFVIQYFATDWLFIQKVVFLIDGKTFEYAPGIWKRDNNSDIWEYNDSMVNSESFLIINKLISSKDAKIRFVGQQYYKDKGISGNQKAAMKKVLEIYQGLSGKAF
jgi:hypothetical protein